MAPVRNHPLPKSQRKLIEMRHWNPNTFSNGQMPTPARYLPPIPDHITTSTNAYLTTADVEHESLLARYHAFVENNEPAPAAFVCTVCSNLLITPVV